MQKWEYKVHKFTATNEEEVLNTFGQDGWELVSVTPGTEEEYSSAYLKRPVMPERINPPYIPTMTTR